MAIQRLCHVGICVSDLGRSVRFYRDGLGFRELSGLEMAGEPAATLLGLDDLKLRAVYLERDGTRIELLHYPTPGHEGDGAPRPMNRLGLTHLSVRVEDLAEASATLRRLGGRVLEASKVWNEQPGVGAVFATDPDGTRIELVQAPGDPSALPGFVSGSGDPR